MFSYSVKVRKINNAKLKGVATLIIDDILEIDGFKIIEGSNGLFVTPPSHKGTVVEDGQKVEKYFDDIRFVQENGIAFRDEMKQTILEKYTNMSDDRDYANSRPAAKVDNPSNSNPPATKNTSNPPRTKKPLWGF